ncbi:heat shock protein HtpX [Mycobacteroides salmoniphilum]|uniref:Heat shock protein HtpX n=2 Tax=Mycobacteroides salmoniphilum TaxID=404941 RepID=A0A4R8SBI5_9MYCO|nr:heat shock protein HtpX [Mycobacteroides salmoniphilum]TEA07153.1 heat shock protein HtpX [Mycobacteroides salmoniphilum]
MTVVLCQVAPRSVTVARMYPVGLPQYTYPPRRHPWEIGLLVVVILFTVLLYIGAIFGIVGYLADPEHVQLNIIIVALAATPLTLFLGRGILYGQQRVNGVKMSPTQFPEGYAMVLEAAQRFGLQELPDAYVVLGNGQINAFASGHGFRRFVVVYSDLFEIGGEARDPEALAFIIGHEVGHIAAGHASYWRQFAQTAMNFVPFLGTSLSRSMEYTADNHGYAMRPTGIQGAIGVMAAGKYLLKRVEFDTLANRATLETGFFVWLVNMLSSHPVHTWRAAALRNRQQAGSLFFRPKLLPPTPIPPVPPLLPPAPPPIHHGYLPPQQAYTFGNPPPRY